MCLSNQSVELLTLYAQIDNHKSLSKLKLKTKLNLSFILKKRGVG